MENPIANANNKIKSYIPQMNTEVEYLLLVHN